VTDRVRCGTLAMAIVIFAAPAFAEDYPTRPITDIVASTPGGGTDIISRIVGEQLAKQLGQPFVVENIPGAGSLNGTLTAAKAAPDGYTLTTGLIASMAVNPSLFAHLPYDPIRDFEPIAMLAKFPFAVVVSKNLAAHSIKELIALAKAKPGEINFASAGAGTGQHLSAELFQLLTGIKLTHVPYRGAQPAYADVMSGQVPVFFDNLASALGQIQGGNVRALAVTGTKRSPLLPDVPTVAESGVPDYQYYCMVRTMGAEKNAATDHRQAARRGRKSARRADRAAAHRGGRRRTIQPAACRDHALCPSRDREMGRRRQARGRDRAVALKI
jgi:tripartite-type tricarboxylate transporter receptor subunit TctC